MRKELAILCILGALSASCATTAPGEVRIAPITPGDFNLELHGPTPAEPLVAIQAVPLPPGRGMFGKILQSGNSRGTPPAEHLYVRVRHGTQWRDVEPVRCEPLRSRSGGQRYPGGGIVAMFDPTDLPAAGFQVVVRAVNRQVFRWKISAKQRAALQYMGSIF